MKEENLEADFVIIGTGMGGLSCGYMLARNGHKVILLERNKQYGGNLQVFSRDGALFDTGVHYMGGLDKGQILHQLFKYFGIIDELKLIQLDKDGFDHIHFKNEEKTYCYGQGYEKFIANLVDDFPDEANAIHAYCNAIKNVVDKLPLAKLEPDTEDGVPEIDFTLNAKNFINGLTENKQLQKVLAGNIALYAGNENTPFYVHALVLHYYIESSWRCVDGSGRIAKLMVKQIRALGGEVFSNSDVISAEYEKDKIACVVLKNGKKIFGKNFISNVHPQSTLAIFGKENFNPNYVRRITHLKNTEGMFVLHLVFHANAFPYMNYNYFQLNNDDVWDLHYTQENWPTFYMATITPSSKNKDFATGMSVICGMSFKEVERWANTFNSTLEENSRGEDYELFKHYKAEKVIADLEKHFPGIRQKIKSYTSSTPLTQRDYTNTPNGSGYGIEKDSNNPFKTILSSKTSIPNLYLTGQNLTLHGILGVSLTAITTCANFIDKNELLKQIREA